MVARSKLPDLRIYHVWMKHVQFQRRIVAAIFDDGFGVFRPVPFLATIAHMPEKIKNRIKERKMRKMSETETAVERQ